MNALKTRAQMRGQGGFTLIELLIVIAILGILAGVVVYAVGGTTDTAKKQACKTGKQTIETAAEAYKADKATYPDSITDLVGSYIKKDTKDFTTSGGLVTVVNTGDGKYSVSSVGDCA